MVRILRWKNLDWFGSFLRRSRFQRPGCLRVMLSSDRFSLCSECRGPPAWISGGLELWLWWSRLPNCHWEPDDLFPWCATTSRCRHSEVRPRWEWSTFGPDLLLCMKGTESTMCRIHYKICSFRHNLPSHHPFQGIADNPPSLWLLAAPFCPHMPRKRLHASSTLFARYQWPIPWIRSEYPRLCWRPWPFVHIE